MKRSDLAEHAAVTLSGGVGPGNRYCVVGGIRASGDGSGGEDTIGDLQGGVWRGKSG